MKDSNGQLDAWYGKDRKGRDYVIEYAGALSVSDGEWKYIYPNRKSAYNKLTNTELGNAPAEQLYYLKKDKGEQVNRAEQNPDKIKELKAYLEAVR